MNGCCFAAAPGRGAAAKQPGGLLPGAVDVGVVVGIARAADLGGAEGGAELHDVLVRGSAADVDAVDVVGVEGEAAVVAGVLAVDSADELRDLQLVAVLVVQGDQGAEHVGVELDALAADVAVSAGSGADA